MRMKQPSMLEKIIIIEIGFLSLCLHCTPKENYYHRTNISWQKEKEKEKEARGVNYKAV